MAVYTLESVQANIRVQDGRRTFTLPPGDHLTPSARSWLREKRVALLDPAETPTKTYRTLDGATYTEKPEHLTHLRGDLLVPKTHPRIRFRGWVDTLEAETLLAARQARDAGRKELASDLDQALDLIRRFIPCDVLGEPLAETTLCGLTMAELRERSHHPDRYYGQPHFMPGSTDSHLLLTLNHLRTQVRAAELSALRAFRDADGLPTRPDLLLAFNRLSSLLWILMIQLKKEEEPHDA